MTAADLARIMPDVARIIWGEPNPRHSNGTELRWGTNGARSIDVAKGVWFDNATKEGGGVIDLLKREGVHDPWKWLRDHGFAEQRENGAGKKRKIVATYEYSDEQGNVLFQVCRFEPKTFRQRRRARPDDPPDKVKGGWIWSVKGVRKVPFRLPEIIEALALEQRVFIVEGEKDVLTLARHGIAATCNAEGAHKWDLTFAEHFIGADIIIIPDNDKDGREHAQEVARSLTGKASRIRIVDLPSLPDKGDVSEWFATGGTVEAFNALVDDAPDWIANDPSDLSENTEDKLGLAFAALHEAGCASITPAVPGASGARRTGARNGPGSPSTSLATFAANAEKTSRRHRAPEARRVEDRTRRRADGAQRQASRMHRRPMGSRSVPDRRTGDHRRTAHRPQARATARGLHHQARRHHARRRSGLSAMATLSRRGDRRRRRDATLPATMVRILPDSRRA